MSDNGIKFTSNVFTKLSKLFNTYQKFASPYHPATNEAVKRANGILIAIPQKMASSDPTHWPTYLDTALLAYCVIIHQVINMSHLKALYGQDIVFHSRVLPMASLYGPHSANTGMRLITKKLIRL